MHRTRLLAKLAFICNLFFGLCVLLQRWAPPQGSASISMVAILGLVLGMCLANPVSNIINGVVLLRQQPLFQWVPRWLAFSNFFFLLVQFFYLLRTWS